MDLVDERSDHKDNVQWGERKLTKKDLMSVFWRSQTFQLSQNFERMQNLCYCFCMLPVFLRLYPDKKELAVVLKRQLEFFNTMQFVSSPIFGINAAMEEARANKSADITEEAITSMKVALMGPLAGLGDPIFWGTLRPMLGAVAAGISMNGNIIGPILFFVVFNTIRLLVRYYGLMLPYQQGVHVISSIKDIMPKFMKAITVLAYTIMGGLVARWTVIKVPMVMYSYESEGKQVAVTVQSQLDSIMPNMLPLALTFGVLWMINKKVSPIAIILGLMVLGIVGYWLGFLG